MWSNISAPKSALKAAKVGQQQANQQDKPRAKFEQQDELMEQQENQSKQLASIKQNNDSPEGSPLMRYKHAVCSSPNSNFIYVHGGRFANGMPLDDDVWRFDAHENSWLQLKTSGCKPPSLQEHTLSEHRDHLYLFGGQVSAASGQERFFWRLDLAKRHWVSLGSQATSCSSLKYGARLGPTNRRGHSACVYRDSIYIFGGYEDFRGSSDQLWQFDLLSERWELRNLSSSSACHPEPRHNHSAVIYQDDMYIYGGLSNLKPLGDLWRWSWRDKRWFRERTRGQSPGLLHGHSAIQAFGSMFVFGGERQSGRTTCSLWRLNLSNLCWKKIKPRGPRPNPTTWHAAIANPLGILDEANYLIEGDLVGAELEQEQRPMEQLAGLTGEQHRQQQLQSMSDNYIQTNMQHEQTRPMQLIRPTMPTSDASHHHQHPQLASTNAKHLKSRLKVSRSSCEQMSQLAKQALGSQSRPSTSRSRRRLRLSFLRRNRKQCGGGEVRQLPISKSAAGISTGSLKQLTPSLGNSRRNSTETDANEATDSMEADVEMDLDEHCQQQADEQRATAEGNLAILNSLDTDIKQMFQRALSPELDGAETRDRMARDSITQSSLAPTSLTQTYQTARDHLSSQSTMTITLNEQQVQKAATGAVVAQESRRMAQHQQVQPRRTGGEANASKHRGRPKSEIVQSLIDRADARIKIACMPLFNPEGSQQQQQPQQQQQQLRSRFGSNELSILGELANHRMFERPKRHTIHQTMTYYNLYFADERRQENSSSGGGGSGNDEDDDNSNSRPPSNEMAAAERRAESGGQTTGGSQPASNSLSAALVGVRDGGSSSGGDLSQKTMTLGGSRLESEVGSLMQSSDSRTLCNELAVNDDLSEGDLGREKDPVRRGFDAFATTRHKMTADERNGFNVRDEPDEFDRADMNQQNNTDSNNNNNHTSNSVADNTSLSFSVIAEFEEDDILRYSSPTELDHTMAAMDDKEQGDERARERLEQAEDEDDHRGVDPELKAGGRVLAAQKSTSSGYESIQSQQWSSQQQAGANAELSPGGHSAPRARPAFSTTSASSTTAESLALTTTNDTNSDFGPLTPPSRSLPSSPPDSRRKINQSQLQLQQQQRPRHSNSFASSLMSGPSRLFGKRRIKTRYWQLCMFVIGGKQQGGQHNTGNPNEPITIWRLYI